MAWAIVCIGVIIAALAMWDSIHDELPEQLRLPRSSETASQRPSSAEPTATPVIDDGHWAVVADAYNLRASREFHGGIVTEGVEYYPPIFHVSCYNGSLFAWISTGLQAQAVVGRPGYAAVRLNGGPVEYWQKAEGTVLIAPSPAKLVNLLTNRPELAVDLAFEEAPLQRLRLGTGGIAALASRLSNCSSAPAE